MRGNVTFTIGLALLAAAAGILWRCSSIEPDAPTLDQSGRHTAAWNVDHRASFVNGRTRCNGCHGSDLRGGISQISCFSPSFRGQSCHAKGPAGHPPGWRDPALHGAAAKSQPGSESGFTACRVCHGTDFSGGGSGVSCFIGSRATGPCHVRDGIAVPAPHAPLPWKAYPAPTHTDTVGDDAGSNAGVCALCHRRGANLRNPLITTYNDGAPGCFNSTLCHGVTGHPAGWAEPNNHGSTAKSNLAYCRGCHASPPDGGPGSNPRFAVQLGRLIDPASGRTGCEVCHAPFAAHPRVLQIPAAFGAITTLNPLNTPWYLHCKASPSGFSACSECHGANLDGAGAAAGATGCTFCHLSSLPTTEKNCTSCHSAPPSGGAYPDTARAHPAHAALNTNDICEECHTGLGSVTLDHFLRSRNHTASVQPGAVRFGAFARTGGADPVYNDAALQCTNTYCHGATLAGGSNTSPRWDEGAYLTPAGCATCHGFPPPTAAHAGIAAGAACKTCHQHVNAANTDFDDPTRHVNGVIDTAGGIPHAFPNPGSAHAASAGSAPFSGCVVSGCHANGGAIGGYPVAAGAPPDCRACHVKAGPGNSCGSCHGGASSNALTAGRPNGAAFPDVAGRHASPHTSFACSVCHGSNGSGSASHGASNRTAHSDADVAVQFTGEAAGIVFTRSGLNDGRGSCTGTCHGETHVNFRW